MFGLKSDCILDIPEEYYTLADYESAIARWCPGCGDHGILTSVQRLCSEKQLAPENTVFVSGIGCSSRFPHYMKTYGFHGLHGRALPVACGVKFRRPDLHVFVATGDGDCCSIGTAHWIHAIRYNMNITVLLLDNEIYGLTKGQTSPTSSKGTISNTNPRGSILPPINPIQTTLGVANASFVAQTVDWNPAHLYATIEAGFEHPGFSFIRILQRCPVFQKELFQPVINNPDEITLLTHKNGIQIDPAVAKMYKHTVDHDPSNLHEARELAENLDRQVIGLLYQDKTKERYDLYGAHNMGITPEEKQKAINLELDKFAV
ncbi:2-oxoglutarate oxidoreductase [bacterium]|nr:MAG: 2-oxoglutarate oxidoreductase [bacterium]MBL7959101.1 2-oxoglutarate oxidoreductase [bacterium]